MRASVIAAAILELFPLVAASPVRAQEAADPVARGKKLSEWIRILREGEPAARETAVKVIGGIGVRAGAAAVRPVAESLGTGTEKVRMYGAWALGCIAGGTEDERPLPGVAEALREHALAPLVALLRDGYSDVRLNGAWALGCIRRGDPATIEGLVSVLGKDAVADVRMNACWALLRIASGVRGTAPVPDGIVPGLAAALADADQKVRSNAASGLFHAREAAAPALPAVVARLESKSDVDRTDALAVLGRVGPGGAAHADAVRPLLADPAAGVRRMAVMFFLEQRRGLAECVPALIRLLDDKDEKVRANAVCALGAVRGSDEDVKSALTRRAGVEKDPAVLGNLKAVLKALEGGLPRALDAGGTNYSDHPSEHHSVRLP